MKKILVLLVALSLFLASFQAVAQAQPAPKDSLVVAHTTMMNGNFLSEIWGSNTADIDVRSLIHEYPLVVFTRNGNYAINTTVVRSVSILTDEKGNHVHTVSLQPDLRFSDGSLVHARHYLFTLLFFASPQMFALTGLNDARDYILGMEDFRSGKKHVVEGLKMLDDHTFLVTIDAKYLPYEFQLNYINAFPIPYESIFKDLHLIDQGEGATCQSGLSQEDLKAGLFDPETGYISHPKVTSGPYVLTSYDPKTSIAKLDINPYYKGNYEGQKPSIKHLEFRNINNEDIIPALLEGRVDLVNKVTDGMVVNKALAYSNKDQLEVQDYQRTGGAFLAFSSERPVFNDQATRHALAFMIDYDLLPKQFLVGRGERIYGYYGLGQWMAKAKKAELMKMQPYTLDLKKAKELLVSAGWTQNEAGQPFKEGQDTLRYRKQKDGSLLPLSIVMAISRDNQAAKMLFDQLASSLKALDGEIQQIELPLNEALSRFYRQKERDFDLFFMGTNFSYLFDPSDSFRMGEEFQGAMNTSGIQDEQLAKLAFQVTHQPENDQRDYLTRWMDFQQYWSEVLPRVPLYGNTYYDLFRPELTNYKPQLYWNWGTAILYAQWK